MADWNAVDILLAEDDDFDAELIVLALRKAAPAAKVLRVCDGVEALQFIFRQGSFASRHEAAPKVVLLDLEMPRADGLEVLRQIRECPATKDLPVGILTASLKQSDYFRTQELQVWDYLVKPVSTQALMDLIKQIGL